MTNAEEKLQELFNRALHPLIFLYGAGLTDPGAAHEAMKTLGPGYWIKWQPFVSWGTDTFGNPIPAFRKFDVPEKGRFVGRKVFVFNILWYSMILVECYNGTTALFIWNAETKTLFYVDMFEGGLDDLIVAADNEIYGIVR